MGFAVLAINPGSTSTKIAWFVDDVEKWRENISHPADRLAQIPSIAAQFDLRRDAVLHTVSDRGDDVRELAAVVGRGGLLDPIPGGTYHVDEDLMRDLRRGKPWEHASNLGGLIADAIAHPLGIPAFIVDPVAVDEMEDISRITGLPELPKRSLGHALNVKAVVRRAAREMGHDWRSCNFVVAHMGGGITVCSHRQGRMVDLNNANELGPFSPERAGGIPAGDLARLCYSGSYTLQEIRKALVGAGGLVGYLGTSDVREVKSRIAKGDAEAKLVYESMAYQVAKDIGAYAVPLEGKTDAILLTGGIAHDVDFVALVRRRVEWIAPVRVYPGEDEMPALAEGAIRVLRGEEPAKKYAECVKREE